MFFSSFTFQQGHGEIETHPEKKNKMIKWLGNWSKRLGYKKRPKDMRLFHLEKRSLKGNLIVFKHRKEFLQGDQLPESFQSFHFL